MAQAGGGSGQRGRHEATADSPENVEALDYVKTMLADGSSKFPPTLDAGWGGEAFGTGKAAMTIEGNWIKGAMTNDFPDVKYTVVAPLPEGPAGPGHARRSPTAGASPPTATTRRRPSTSSSP